MTDKARTSVTIDPALLEEIRDTDTAFSPLVERWTTEYLTDGRAMTELTDLDQLYALLDDLEAEAKADVERRYDRIRDTLPDPDTVAEEQAVSDDLDADLDRIHDELTTLAFEDMRSVATQIDQERSPRDPENDAIRRHANRLGLEVSRLVDELEARDQRLRDELTADDETADTAPESNSEVKADAE